ncbi:phytanoyl-CoA hydroxylase-interacting protein-like isoform X3 [Haliotis rubra]|nr:phytanoyl-CoA hydroxylase-interacting protein-like isoform X3 [Haliotis rubra]
MMPSVKDNGGDPRCPINGKLEGVFFGVTLWNGGLPTKSPYGNTRVVVPLERLFDDSARLYFADFYCMQGQRNNHYVTLVLTEPDTEADLFCKQHLIRLKKRKNVFLRKEKRTYQTLRQHNVWVEVFYTDEVNISGLMRYRTGVIGRGSSSGEYLRKLLRKAEEHCSSGTSDIVSTLYRNKRTSYFDDIKENCNNIMEPYLKDNGGDPRCPINGKLKGLFFNVTLVSGSIPANSPFGDTRVRVPLSEVFDDSANLYFADFYCKPSRSRRVHYVTLVLTRPGSDADSFCQQHLIKLNSHDNTYLSKTFFSYKTLDRDAVHVEVMYTEAVDLTHRCLTLTGTFGQGHSTPGGRPKTVGCSICSVDETFDGYFLHDLTTTE